MIISLPSFSIDSYVHLRLFLHSWLHFGEEHLMHGRWHPAQFKFKQSHKSSPVWIYMPFSLYKACLLLPWYSRLWSFRFSLSLCSGSKFRRNFFVTLSTAFWRDPRVLRWVGGVDSTSGCEGVSLEFEFPESISHNWISIKYICSNT